MRTRTREFHRNCNNISQTTTRNQVSPPLDIVQFKDSSKSPNSPYMVFETISDEVNLPMSKQARAISRRRLDIAKRLKDPVMSRSVQSDLYTESLQVHKCVHTKKSISVPDSLTYRTAFNANNSYTYTFTGAGALCRHMSKSITDKQALASMSGITKAYSASGFYEPDWFALLDKWHETCNSILPSSSMIGESMVEHDIFLDAFKVILNPTNILKVFLQRARKLAKRKTKLGKLSEGLRTSSDAYLSYNFGVKPAIDEIKNIFEAHRKVQSRLNFLRSNVGGYVPVRARTYVPSSFTNNNVVTRSLLCDRKETIGVISALGKVRPDLDYIEDWQAYVQFFGLHKFIGLAWELVPFSFVLDWVTNAGDYISRYTTPNFGSPFYNLRNLCYSKKEILQESYWIPNGLLHSETSSTLVDGPVKLGSITTSTYTRNPGLPKTSGSVDFSRLGTFHYFASGSLLIQKILK